jgi:mycothiol system anti-sigma-R factor
MNEDAAERCSDVLERLWEYLDGELGAAGAAGIREHLDRCARCYPQYDFQKAFKEFLRSQSGQPAPPALRRAIFQRLLEEESGDR